MPSLTDMFLLGWLPIVTYISSSDRKSYTISLMILCNISTIKETQVHWQKNPLICFQTFHAKHHLPSHENTKAAISQFVLRVPQDGSPPHFFSICTSRGFFQKDYFNTVQLMYHIWTTNLAPLAYRNLFHNIQFELSLTFHWRYNDALWWEKKSKQKALHYKFSLSSGDLPSWYWASMSKLRWEVACMIRSIYKAKHKLVQYHICNSPVVTHMKLDILYAEVNN